MVRSSEDHSEGRDLFLGVALLNFLEDLIDYDLEVVQVFKGRTID